MARLIPVSRSEGGDERNTLYEVRHKCPQGITLERHGVSDEPDLLTFPVGLSGWELPLNVPFAVESMFPCTACGAYVKAWFEWTGPKLWSPGEA